MAKRDAHLATERAESLKRRLQEAGAAMYAQAPQGGPQPCDEIIRFTRPESCAACQGSGAKAGTTPRRCESCGGTGQRVASERRAGISFQQISPCPVCGARGHIIDQPCPSCGGRGTVQRQEELAVKIPVGVEEGMVLRIPGRGLPSEELGGRPW